MSVRQCFPPLADECDGLRWMSRRSVARGPRRRRPQCLRRCADIKTLQRVRKVRARSMVTGVTTRDLRCWHARWEMSPSRTRVLGILHCRRFRSLIWSRWLLLPASTVGPFAEGTPVELGAGATGHGASFGDRLHPEAPTAYHRPCPPSTSAPSHVGQDVIPAPGAIGMLRADLRLC